MSAVGPTPERPHPTISLGPVLREAGIGGVTLVGDGGVEHVYAERVAASATTVGDAGETLARVAALARTTSGVAEVLARLPVPGVPTLHAAHPGWHLDHPRAGHPIAALLGQSPHCAKNSENSFSTTMPRRRTWVAAPRTSDCGSTPAPVM